jgi:hypothetical protein
MMLNKFIIFVGGILIFCNSCKQDQKLNNCANVKCASPFIELKLKFIDKQTENDLLFGLNKKYKLNDVNIYSSRLKKDIDFKVDSTDLKSSSIVFNSNSSDEFTVSIAKIKADVLKVETKYTKTDCCGTLELAGFTSNYSNSAFAFNNSNIIIIKI